MEIKIEKSAVDYFFVVEKRDYQRVINFLEGRGFSVSGLPPELSNNGKIHFNNAHPEKIAEAMRDFPVV